MGGMSSVWLNPLTNLAFCKGKVFTWIQSKHFSRSMFEIWTRIFSKTGFLQFYTFYFRMTVCALCTTSNVTKVRNRISDREINFYAARDIERERKRGVF